MLATDLFQIIFISIVAIVGISGMIMVVRSKDDED
jgi:hypothetical protein